MIYVCSLSRVAETVTSVGARRLISLLSAGTPMERPASLLATDHLLLTMHDITVEQPDMTPPGLDHVQAILAFANGWDRSKPLVVNCFAGISRSTATAYIVAAALSPKADERRLADALRRASPSATPNIRLVSIADAIMGRKGRMVAAIEAIGRGADAMEGVPFRLDLET
ncbi:MAG: tyrosine phosphatase family protein [Rhizobiaceae bacterium]|nr:tyrosine phosphatase family protein [Rhizobiaceae bacterium]